MGSPVVSPIPWGFLGGGGRTEVLEPLRIHGGVVFHPARHPESHAGSSHGLAPWQPPFYGKRPSSAIIFAMIRRGADDEKTPAKVRRRKRGR